MSIAIVVVGYNRIDSMKRLLASVAKAEYENDTVDLIISLDKSAQQEKLIEAAKGFHWPWGKKLIRAFEERQGLKKHVLQCGDLTERYEAVVVLEDDLVVSPAFYSYVKQSLAQYGDDDRIAGISLYLHQTVPGAYRPFIPEYDGSDVFLMQYAQSWGQCWTRRMWAGFRSWYAENDGPLKPNNYIPDYVAAWDDRSWLKYFILYTAFSGKYFVYPYISLSTNAAEAGEHTGTASAEYQVPLLKNTISYRFPPKGGEVRYDVFFERVYPEDIKLLGLSGNVKLDLYGSRTDWQGADYLISTAQMPYEVVKTLGLSYRPHEKNLELGSSGSGIYVYDLHSEAKKAACSALYTGNYDIRALSWKTTLRHGLHGFWQTLLYKLKIK